MIAIMGASGATGGPLLRRLTDLGVPRRALTREPERLRAELPPGIPVDVRWADAADPASLRNAFTDVRQLFLTMTNSPRQVEFESRVIDLAAHCGIEHIVKISAPAAEPDSPVVVSRWHYAIEQHLLRSGIDHTILRPYAFMQKLLTLAPTIQQGIIVGATQDAACNYIDCRDIGDVAAEVLTRPEIAGGTYTLTGSETFGYPRLAALLSRLLGRQIRYVDLPPTDFRQTLLDQAHMPLWLATHVMEIQQLALSRPEHPTDTVAHLLGRPPRTLEAFLAESLESGVFERDEFPGRPPSYV
ncbi:MAG: nucleoside-diphosphate sugar epimerase [Nocardia sp.]|uniref:NmrA family NAD(P)-binding protein n=1 Tax=Nocardia sp. TaxID=1821 RepID=UPI00260C8F76|nr:NmrA family NAD(P)-binding protein [Nocardia sp.]MCU1642874.1 nucleoside-diphosphate sugar epimerase [Nocardia sp.]